MFLCFRFFIIIYNDVFDCIFKVASVLFYNLFCFGVISTSEVFVVLVALNFNVAGLSTGL